MGRLNQPSACGPLGKAGSGHHVQLENVPVELLVQLEPAALVHPAEDVDEVHPEVAAGPAREEDRGLVLADPVIRDRVRAVDDLLAGRVEHLERRHDRPRGQGLDLQGAARELVHALGDELEVIEDRQGGGPARLHLEDDRRLGRGHGEGRATRHDRDHGRDHGDGEQTCDERALRHGAPPGFGSSRRQMRAGTRIVGQRGGSLGRPPKQSQARARRSPADQRAEIVAAVEHAHRPPLRRAEPLAGGRVHRARGEVDHHALAPDGVYVRRDPGSNLSFHATAPPSQSDLADILTTVRVGLRRRLERRV